jgi:hypothetical protein
MPFFWQIAMGCDNGENVLGIPSQEISNCVGAFHHEGAFLCPYMSIKEEFTYVRPLRAREEGK